jgi:hypothetical protein
LNKELGTYIELQKRTEYSVILFLRLLETNDWPNNRLQRIAGRAR